MKSFFKKLLATTIIGLCLVGAAFLGEKYLGLDIDETISYVSDQVTSARNNLQSFSFASFSNDKTHYLNDNGPMEGTGRPQSSTTLSDPVNTGEEYTFDSTTYPYRAMLTSTEQAIYNQVYANALLSNSELFTLVNSVSESELEDAMNAVFNDHPELFWLNTSYKYQYDNSGKVVAVQLSFGISSSSLSAAQSEFDSAVETIVSGASAYSTEIDKELYVHDAISALASYNENAELNQSAYSALVTGETVCAGYARAFQYVCQQLGLTCYYATGTASNSDHAWNVISIEGDFYNVDLTWDDSISESYGSNVYTYFNLTDAAFENHTRTGLSVNLPACTATAMSYTNVYGNTLSIDDITTEDDKPVTDGDFTIQEPQQPVIQWNESQPNNQQNQQPATQPTTTQPQQTQPGATQQSMPSNGQPGSNNQPTGQGQSFGPGQPQGR